MHNRKHIDRNSIFEIHYGERKPIDEPPPNPWSKRTSRNRMLGQARDCMFYLDEKFLAEFGDVGTVKPSGFDQLLFGERMEIGRKIVKSVHGVVRRTVRKT
jgi:hypothetical protein